LEREKTLEEKGGENTKISHLNFNMNFYNLNSKIINEQRNSSKN